MKKLLLVTSMFLCFTGVVSASSINGDYKGNPIVKLKSNGSLIDTGDVPAMIYDGKTMVPIAALRNLGAEVTWDQNTYSVDVKINNQKDTSSAIDVNKLKFYSRASHYYNTLETLGDMIQNVGVSSDFAFRALSYGDNSDKLKKANDNFNNVVASYNATLEPNKKFIADAVLYNEDVTDTNDILNSYSRAIDYYRESLSGLSLFSIVQNDANYSKYSNNDQSGFNTAFSAKVKSSQRYQSFYDLTQK